MSKLIVVYTIFSVILFGSLFAAFFVSGLGAPNEEWTQSTPPDPSAEPAPQTPAPVRHPGIDHPDLAVGRLYRVSHATPMFEEPVAGSAVAETLPARGYFTVESSVETGMDLWYRVTVSDGRFDFSRFILAEDLNFKRVDPVSGPNVTAEDKREALAEIIRQHGTLRVGRQSQAVPVEPEPERVPQSFGEWWAMTADRIGGAQAATVAVSAGAAAIGTALTLGSIFLVNFLRRENTWERPSAHEFDEDGDVLDDAEAFAGAGSKHPDERW